MNLLLRRTLVLCFLLPALLAAAPALAQEGDAAVDTTAAAEAAQAVAEDWLVLVDDGNYEESYNQTAGVLQEKITQDVWMQQSQQKQEQLGDVQSRTFANAQFRESIPQVGDGPFVLVLFEAKYRPATFQEIVLTTKEDGEWKIAGYNLQPMQPAPGSQGGGNSPGGGGR
jgi:hypothetical protein